MQNHFPLWKNIGILLIFLVSVIYALPNLYGDDPSVQVSSAVAAAKLTQEQVNTIETAVKATGVATKAFEFTDTQVLARFTNTDEQMKVADSLRDNLGDNYTVALNLAPTTPSWLRALGADAMYLGLDLRGGVHFLLEVDMDAAVKQAEDRYVDDVRTSLRAGKVHYQSVAKDNGYIKVSMKTADENDMDVAIAIKQVEERSFKEIPLSLESAKIGYQKVDKDDGFIKVFLKIAGEKENAMKVLKKDFQAFDITASPTYEQVWLKLSEQETKEIKKSVFLKKKAEVIKVLKKDFRVLDITEPPAGEQIWLKLSEMEVREIKKSAVAQNMTTLRNRVNELGVAEPVIQQQGENRIVIQLPGVQDTTRAKEILGTTATLEYRLVDTEHDVQQAVAGHVPVGSRLYTEKNGAPILLDKRIIVTGDQIVDAASNVDDNGRPAVSITLNGVGATKMGNLTKVSVGKPMAVVFIEYKNETRIVNGEKIRHKEKVEKVINVATIQGVFSKRFQTTGLDSPQEARNLSLLLKAGALAAPVDMVEERTVGPSLGQDNIDKGVLSFVVGFALVVLFMAVYYRLFGIVANAALAFNVVIVVAILSMLQATLTLPGIAGIILTVGMSVDANVLIFERIKEEIKNGNTAQSAIFAGYDKAFATILDSHFTNFVVAVVLFAFGTGSIKGFAVTLIIGILSSMFTAITGTRMIINWVYGNHRVDKLSI